MKIGGLIKMTKQQYLHASKLLMELAELFKTAGEQVTPETVVVAEEQVIQPLVAKFEEAIEETTVETPEEETVEDLSTMTIQQLRSLAKSNGLSTKGTKKDLIARITENDSQEEQPEEEVVEEVQEPEVIEEVVEEEIEDEDEQYEDEDFEEVEEVEDMEDEELDQMEIIQAELEGMSLEELQEILESVELPTKGKKQALISRILEAVEDGVLEFEEEVDEDYDADEEDAELDEAIDQALEDEDTTDEDDYEEVDEDVEYEDEDEEELSPREATQQEIEEEIAEAYENGDLTDKEIAKFLDEYFNGKFKPINKKRAYNKYVEIMCDLVDVDGDRMDMKEAYYINDEEIYCCGSEIKELDNGNLFCEVCGTEYETE